MQVIEINNVTGVAPYDVYVCDTTITYCYSAATGVSVFPLYIDLPIGLTGAPSVIVKLIDANGCELFYNIGCLLPTPSVTITPSYTPTPTPTPEANQNCFCIQFDNTASGSDIDITYIRCDGILIARSVTAGNILERCGNTPTTDDPILTITILGNCVNGVCPPGI
jgi:hypothetical protein